MQTDSLLQQWKEAKQSCRKIIDISIRANILKLPSQKQSKQEFIKIYDIVYKLCSSPVGEETRVPMVYKDFKEILKNGLVLMSKSLFEERDIHKLSLLRRIFDAFEDSLKRIRHMFAILDRQMIIKQNKTEQLDRTGITILVTSLFGQQSLQQYSAIYFKHLNKIRKTRDLSDSGILRDYAEILYKFHMRLAKKQVKKARTLYTDFQQSYLANAKQYYISLSHKLHQLSPSQYFVQVNDLYEFERRLSEQCFGFTSDSFINKTFSHQFLQQYRKKLAESSKGLKYILQNREIQIITLITNLYKKLTNSIEGFKQPFQSFIYDQISSLLSEVRIELATKKSESICLNFIQKLVKKNFELLQTLEVSFTRFKQFIGYYKSGMEKAFSKNVLPIPIQQMLASYVDTKFRVPFGSQDSMKDQIGHVKNLFECIQNKDVFLLKYLQKLAKRIITITPEGIQNHETLIYFLKLHSGNQITEKLQKIIDEFKISLENEKEFRDVQVHERLSYTMTLHVFSEADWPFPQILEFKYEEIPEQFQRGFDCINAYSKQKYQRKTLRVLLNDSRVRWIYYFDEEVDNKIKEAFFTTSGLQALILSYIYQQRPQPISFKLLCQIFQQIKPSLLKQALKRMHHHQSPILLLTELNQEQFYQFNGLMRSKRHMIQYNNVGEQLQQEQLFQKKELNRQRQFAVDANVAKLMKVKKILGFERIVEEVGKMVKVFIPSVRDIKSSVQRLLGKDVLIRDEKDKNIIKYKD